MTRQPPAPACERTVMVVDDDPSIRTVLSTLLELEGFAVVTADNGRQALDLLAHGPRPCLIVLDLMMPVMSGYEFLAIWRQDPGCRQIPVVVASAARIDRALPDVASVLPKPIDLGRLERELARFC